MKITHICLSVLCILYQYSIFTQNDSVAENLSENRKTYYEHDVRQGERIFHGFIPSVNNTVKCASVNGYFRFAQFMPIGPGNIPEETNYHAIRWTPEWKTFRIPVIVFNWAIRFSPEPRIKAIGFIEAGLFLSIAGLFARR
jgi:hypothetical protein